MPTGEMAITNRLLISEPPQHGKSDFISKWFPAWYLGKRPMHRIIHNSYGDRYSQAWGRRARGVMREVGPTIFGVKVSDEKSEQREWEIAGHGGSMFSAGVKGECTGRPAELVIIDDPHKNAEEAVSELEQEKTWDMVQSGPLTRLADGGSVVGVATRWHPNDLFGRMMQRWDEEGLPYRFVNLAALATADDELGRPEGEPLCPQLKSLAFLQGQKKTLSTYWWNALYQGRPTQHDKAEFPGEYFGDHLWVREIPGSCYARAVVLDPSKGKSPKRGDFSASVFVGVWENVAYVDARLERCAVSNAVENTLDLAFRYNARVVGYEANNFQELIGGIFEQRLAGHRLHGLTIVPIINTASKEGRIQSLDPFLRNGELRFVDNPHTRLLVNQLKEFPMAAHDDGPDALEMAIRQSLAQIIHTTPQADVVAETLAARGFQ
jgi:predicted phage terminase large subunit-like protein